MLVIVSWGNHMIDGESDSLKRIEKQAIYIIKTQSLIERKDIDCQVSEVSVALELSSSQHPDVELKQLPKKFGVCVLERKL